MTKREKKTQWVTDRDRKRIAARFPILIEMEQGGDYWPKSDGQLVFTDVLNRDTVQFRYTAVKRFDAESEVENSEKIRGFGAVALLDGITESGKVDIEVPIAGGKEKIELRVAEAFAGLVKDLLPDRIAEQLRKSMRGNVQDWAATWLGTAATANLDSARLVIWRPRAGTPGPAIYCPNKQVAAFVSLAFSKLFTGLRACLQCGRIFMPTRLDQDYHDRRCADLHRKRRKSTREKNGGTK